MGERPVGERVVITGGTFSGKTTLVRALSERGFRTVPEAAIQVIEELIPLMGVEEQVRWRQANPIEFQMRVLQRQIELEAAVGPGEFPVFFDRGRPDGVAYMRLGGHALPAALQSALDDLPYGRVFLLETLAEFDQRSDSGRTSDRERSLRTRDHLRDVYNESGYEPVLLPEMALAKRVATVLSHLGYD